MTFDKPTNTWIEEEVDVPAFEPKVNEAEGSVEFVQTTKKATRKTLYSDSKPTRVICGEHVYNCLDKGRSLFKCHKCDWHRIALPVTFKFDPSTGILTYRRTGVRA